MGITGDSEALKQKFICKRTCTFIKKTPTYPTTSIGGNIRIVIDGFADATLLGWLFDRFRQEDGAIVTLDEHETTFAKLQFAGASVKSYRMNYDSRVKKGVVTIIVIEAKEIATDNDLFFTNK